MRTRPLGRTGLTVSPIGLGLAALGRPAYIDLGRAEDLGTDRDVEAMASRAHEVLDAAYTAGIRYVDAARSYGHAERFLASWLAARPQAGDVTVGSKWGYTYVGEWRTDVDVHEVKDHSVDALRRQTAASLALLDGRLDLYQIHSATLDSGVLDDRAVLAELVRLADAHGLVIGLSVSGPQQAGAIRRALEAEIGGVRPFRSVQATWNLLEPSVGPALADAHDEGWGVIVKESLANGRLAGRGDPSVVAELEAVGERHSGASADAVALAAALAQPWADVVLSGAVTTRQVRSNAAATELALDPDDLHRLAGLAEASESYWTTRAELGWS